MLSSYPSTSPSCPLLNLLPPELRLEIYHHLLTPTHTSLLLRSTSKLETISPAKNAHAGLLRTCHLIYKEAVPLLYSNTTFRVQIYPTGGFPASGNPASSNDEIGSVLARTTTYLHHIRILEIKACVLFSNQMLPVLRLLECLTAALEQAEAEIVELRVSSNLGLSLQWKKLVNGLPLQQSRDGRDTLFRRVLVAMEEEQKGEKQGLKGESSFSAHHDTDKGTDVVDEGSLTEDHLARLRR
jgi:hypothetical protein